MVKIGITSQVARGESIRPSWQSYIDGVRRAGAEPVLLDWVPDRAAELLASVDGLLITGGHDIDPALYGEASHPTVSVAPAQRDAFELAVARQAFASEVPALGICRGVQVMNVALGGTLVQDIPSMLPRAGEHQQQYPQPGREAHLRGQRTHAVRIEPGSLLADVLGAAAAQRLDVNSMHHQAIGRVAEVFAVSAYALESDRNVEIVEALEARRERHPFYLGVQWHPEELANPDVGGDTAAPDARALFSALVEAAQRRGAVRR